MIIGIPIGKFKVEMYINPIHYYDFHRRPSHWDNVIHNAPWGTASYHHFTAHAFSELKTLRNTHFWQNKHNNLHIPFQAKKHCCSVSWTFKAEVTINYQVLKSLALAILCTYVCRMVSTINTGYSTSINRLLFIMFTDFVLCEVKTRFVYIYIYIYI
jgi:hypothetical protein